MTELQLQLADTARHLAALAAKIEAGEVPDMGDVRLFTVSADWLGKMLGRHIIDTLSKQVERMPAEDRAAQRYIETKGRH